MPYVNITADQMKGFLEPQGFVAVTLPNTLEMVFAKRVDWNDFQLSLRVYTGINPNGNSRDVGADAIRCNIFWRKVVDGKAEMVKVWTSKRVNRVESWQKNLADRLLSANVASTSFKLCSECGGLMVIRTTKGKKGSEFYGCGNYPNCKHTEAA